MLSVNNLSIFIGGKDLFDEVSFLVTKKDRIGLVGKNGAGKSTLLKTIMGFQSPTSGNISKQKEITVGYLPQQMHHNEGNTIVGEVSNANERINKIETQIGEINNQLTTRTDYESDSYMKLIEDLNDLNEQFSLMGGYNLRENIEKFLIGLGFKKNDFDREMNEFSGGWKMRVELCKILIQSPDIILLDEPTNHLDIESIQWLEEFLKNYHGAVILISHDRTFLDYITNRTIEINAGKIYDYKFSYSKYLKVREEELEIQKAAAKNQEKYIKDTEVLINKFRAKKNKAAFAQSLIKKLDKLDKIEVDQIDNSKLSFSFPPAPRSGKVVVDIKNVHKSFEEKVIFDKMDLMLNTQEKVALIGKNGVGKSTFIKTIMGEELCQEGVIEIGHNVSIGYFAQDEAEKLDEGKTVFQTIDDLAIGDIRKRVRQILGSFLFSGEDVDKKVKVLSGGEKTRLALCKLLLTPHNFLVLDEPTNHLDIKSKNVLKQALIDFDGTLLVVSHDRDFLDGLTDRVYEINRQQISVHHEGVLTFLKRKKKESITEFEYQKKKERKAEVKNSDKKDSYTQNKERKKLENKLQNLEKQIAKQEEKLENINQKLANINYEDAEKSAKELEEYNIQKQILDSKMKEWEDVMSLLE